ESRDFGFVRRRRAPLRLGRTRVGHRDDARQTLLAHGSLRAVEGRQDAHLRDHRERRRHAEGHDLAHVHDRSASGSGLTMSIRTATSNGVMTLEIARPEKKNALTLTMYEAMAQALNTALADNTVRAVLIVGQPNAFTAGND